MVNEEDIKNFVFFNFVPFEKSQCVKRIALIIFLNFNICMAFKFIKVLGFQVQISAFDIGLLCYVFGISFLAVIVLAFLMIKLSKTIKARFLSDGITFLYLSLISNVGAYKLFTLKTGNSLIVFFVFLFLLAVAVLLWTAFVNKNMRTNKYTNDNKKQKKLAAPFIFGAAGMLTAKFLLQGASQDFDIKLASVILLMLSLLLGVSVLSFWKVVLLNKLSK